MAVSANTSVRRATVLIGLVVALLGAFAASASAVVNGSPDNGRHPYVGVAVWFAPSGGREVCSGSLVSATVFVTAAHCFQDGAEIFVDTQEDGYADVQLAGHGSAARGVAHVAPQSVGDVAVVKLAGDGLPQLDDRYAQLPAPGFDDTLANNQAVEIVGYGLQSLSPPVLGTRLTAPAKIVPGGGVTGDAFLKISSSEGLGGATCRGDSGGPDLQAGTDVMLAISSYGPSATCKAVAYSQRMDTAGALGFVSGYRG
ncbi:MAG: trypsin-like serine protease [Gaiellaceae bacterium]